MGELFESSGYNYSLDSDNKIDNLLDPFDDWRLPTKDEWMQVLGINNGQKRSGSTVNQTAGAFWAWIQLKNVAFGGTNNSKGLLIFPDGKTITGKALAGVNIMSETYEEDGEEYEREICTKNVVLSELNEYLDQGCVFLPACGHYDCSANNWRHIGAEGHYCTSTTFYNDPSWFWLYFCAGQNPSVISSLNSYQTVRLVKSVN